MASFLAFPFTPVAQASIWSDLVALFEPPSDAPPTGRNSGGAGRGPICALSDEALTNQAGNTVIALIPVKQIDLENHSNRSSEVQIEANTANTLSNMGVVGSFTVEAQPTFWFYVPYVSTSDSAPETSSKRVAQFVLLDETNHPVWHELMNVELSEQPRLVEYPLPYALETGRLYNWYFSVICDSEKLSRNPTVRGWVERTDPTPALQTSLSNASRFEQYMAYAENGIWFETVNSLVNIRRQFPYTNRDVWTSLLTYFNIPEVPDSYVLESAVPTEREVVNGNQLPARM